MTSTSVTSPDLDWPFAPEASALARDEVHVWRVTLDQAPAQIRSFLHKLAADEQARAARFHFARDRDHFTVARGVLRAILGRYLNRAPESLSFCYGAHGKPALAGESGGAAIRFNLSHSHGLALYAIARGRELGIDLERIRCDLAVVEIAERFFSREEVARLRAFPARVSASGVLSLLDAQGGLCQGPRRRTFIAPGSVDVSRPERLALVLFGELHSPPAGYLAALAAEGQGWHLSCWQWSDPRHPSA